MNRQLLPKDRVCQDSDLCRLDVVLISYGVKLTSVIRSCVRQYKFSQVTYDETSIHSNLLQIQQNHTITISTTVSLELSSPILDALLKLGSGGF